MSIKTFEAKAYGTAEEWAQRTGTFVEEHEIDHIIDYGLALPAERVG